MSISRLTTGVILFAVLCFLAMPGCKKVELNWLAFGSKDPSHEPVIEELAEQVSVVVPKPYLNSSRFRDQDFVFAFRVLFFESDGAIGPKDVDFLYRTDESSPFQEVGWGLFGDGRYDEIMDNLYAFQVEIPAKEIGNSSVTFYIEVKRDEDLVKRFPEGADDLRCTLFDDAARPGVPKGMVLVQGGEFRTGPGSGTSSRGEGEEESGRYDEKSSSPRSSVRVESFLMDRYEVSNREYREFCMDSGRKPPTHWFQSERGFAIYKGGHGDYPAEGLNHKDAEEYCKWAGKRLPTEAEWEMAARGADGLRYPWGNEYAPNMANLGNGDDFMGPAPVKSFARAVSPYGCVNMIGNVSEYVSSPTKAIQALMKGGSYLANSPSQAATDDSSYWQVDAPAHMREWVLKYVEGLGKGCRCSKDLD